MEGGRKPIALECYNRQRLVFALFIALGPQPLAFRTSLIWQEIIPPMNTGSERTRDVRLV
jgi:hypothetical protein